MWIPFDTKHWDVTGLTDQRSSVSNVRADINRAQPEILCVDNSSDIAKLRVMELKPPFVPVDAAIYGNPDSVRPDRIIAFFHSLRAISFARALDNKTG